MPSAQATQRDEIQQRLARGESQRAIASALGLSRHTIARVLAQPAEAPVPCEAKAPAAAPVPPAVALDWLEAHAERVAAQARTAYAPWHVLQLTQELSMLLVAVVKEVRHHAHD